MQVMEDEEVVVTADEVAAIVVPIAATVTAVHTKGVGAEVAAATLLITTLVTTVAVEIDILLGIGLMNRTRNLTDRYVV